MTAFVIFTKNEEKTILKVVEDLKLCLKQIPDIKPVVFICDDSEDKTKERAEEKGCKIIKGSRKGLGWSYYLALQHLTSKYELHSIITLDGDGQADFSEIPAFYREFKQGYSLVVGSRFLKKGLISYSYPKINFFGVKVLAFVISFSCLRRFTDSHGGLRVMSPSLARSFRFLGGHSYVQETIIDAVERGLKVKEMPSRWSKRSFGQSRVVRSQIRYAKQMLIPLLIRMKVHWLFGGGSLILLFLSEKPVYIYLMGVCLLIEFYKMRRFKKNREKITSYLSMNS